MFPYVGNNHSNQLIFFRGVETTNQIWWIDHQDKQDWQVSSWIVQHVLFVNHRWGYVHLTWPILLQLLPKIGRVGCVFLVCTPCYTLHPTTVLENSSRGINKAIGRDGSRVRSHFPPMTGNGLYHLYIYIWLFGGWFSIILPTLLAYIYPW